MDLITVDMSRCAKDGLCVAVCASKSLRSNAEGFPEPGQIPGTFCIYCGHCVAVCPTGALVHNSLPQEAMVPASRQFPTAEAVDGLLLSRRSVREFQDRAVSKETLTALLEVARRSPTAGNSQNVHWIVVQDAAKVRQLAAEIIAWMRSASGFPGQLRSVILELWDAGYDFPLRSAPALVLACAPADYGWGKEDCAIALTFVELAAVSRGLGACWAGLLAHAFAAHAPLRGMLPIPEGHAVRGGLMLGYPKYSYLRVPPRKPLKVAWT